MYSIKQRMVMNFMFIIIITVIIMELFLITNIRKKFLSELRRHINQPAANLHRFIRSLFFRCNPPGKCFKQCGYFLETSHGTS